MILVVYVGDVSYAVLVMVVVVFPLVLLVMEGLVVVIVWGRDVGGGC